MSVQQLSVTSIPTAAPRVAAPGGRGVLASVNAAQAAASEALEVGAGSVPDGELSELVSQASVLEAQASALKFALLAEADRRRVADETAATGTDAWAAQLTGSTAAVMRGGLWLARALEEKYDATREAFAAGGIIEDQVRVIVKAGEQLPAQVTDEQRAVAEAALVAKAVDGMDARGLRQTARRMLAVISAKLADVHEATQLEAEERRAEQETWMILEDKGDGTYFGKFVIPELHGQMLLASLERLSSPRRLANNKAGALVSDPTLPGDGPGLSRSEHLGFAFTELIEHLPNRGHGDGVAATLMVHLDYDKLLDQVGSARLDTGIAISASTARRLACEAGIVPAVLGGKSQPLDLGRTRRLHGRAQRQAMSILYETCAAEGCQRPFAWTEIHHPHEWSKGGRTDLDNGIPLCGWHHHRAHDNRYRMQRLPSGEVRFRTTAPGRFGTRIPRQVGR